MLFINFKFIIMKKYIFTIAIAAFFITSCTSSTETDHGHEHNGQENSGHEGHDDHPHDDGDDHGHHQEEFTMDSDTLK